jgi:hypothetical protein
MPARRTHGMDQDIYPWSPIIARRPLKWPDDPRVAFGHRTSRPSRPPASRRRCASATSSKEIRSATRGRMARRRARGRTSPRPAVGMGASITSNSSGPPKRLSWTTQFRSSAAPRGHRAKAIERHWEALITWHPSLGPGMPAAGGNDE